MTLSDRSATPKYRRPRFWKLGPFWLRWERRYYRTRGWFIGLDGPVRRNGDPYELRVWWR